MSEYELEPEVAGGFGPTTILDSTVYPPAVSRLGYEFDGWLGDDLVTTFPVYLVTDRLRTALETAGLMGIEFEHADVTESEEFRDVFPDLELPTWHWMRVTGSAGQADAWPGRKGRLTVSRRFMDLLAEFSLDLCDVTADPAS